MPRFILKIVWALRRWSLRFYDEDYSCCELCNKPTHYEKFSDYYNDVSCCLICCPPGYRDLEAEAIAAEESAA